MGECWLNNGWWLPAGRGVRTMRLCFPLHLLPAPVLHSPLDSEVWPECMSRVERSQVLLHVAESASSVSEWKQLQGYCCHGGGNVFIWPELVDKLLLIDIHRLLRLELYSSYNMSLITSLFNSEREPHDKCSNINVEQGWLTLAQVQIAGRRTELRSCRAGCCFSPVFACEWVKFKTWLANCALIWMP